MKEKGVIIIHHGDSFMEPVVEDMVELGVDVWQEFFLRMIFRSFRNSLQEG